MLAKVHFNFGFLIVLLMAAAEPLTAIDQDSAQAFIGEDLHLEGRTALTWRPAADEHVLVFPEEFSMSIGANRFSSDSAVIWLKAVEAGSLGQIYVSYQTKVYLYENISVNKGRKAKATDLKEIVLEDGRAMAIRLNFRGEIFISAQTMQEKAPGGLELYERAVEALELVQLETFERLQAEPSVERVVELPVKPAGPGLIERLLEHGKEAPDVGEEIQAEPKEGEPQLRYPVNFAPAGLLKPEIEFDDRTKTATVTGRIYLWRKLDEQGSLLELLADSAVVWYAGTEQDERQSVFDEGAITAIYLAGDVVMTEGQRTIRADEIYYDFQQNKAIATNAVMRTFDASRGIPIYVRAAKFRQLAQMRFVGEDITLTSSEFYEPQICLTASTVYITDVSVINERIGEISDSSFDAMMRDVHFKLDGRTIFSWPVLRSNLERPDIALKSVHAGYDGTWGASLETRWYLARLLGLVEPDDTDSTFELDYYGRRGVGTGVDIDYTRDDYFGRFIGYIIDDKGKDRLGRISSRRSIEPEDKLRGLVKFQHRQLLPYNWQFTTETSYSSDENFIEQYYRNEFNTDKEQETIVHIRRMEDNWAVSLLGKGRINDFADKLEEMPTGKFSLKGEPIFNDTLTLYSDTQLSRFRQRIGENHSTAISDETFSFVSHRTELDMPLQLKAADTFKVVPFVAGTFGYDDRSGFTRTVVDGSNTGGFGEDKVWTAEAGVRLSSQYWKIYPDVKSRLWDLNELRHIVEPQLTAVMYEQSDDVVEQRDMLNVGISQRLQTKRGSDDARRTVDWMRLDVDVTLVNNSEHFTGRAEEFIWNNPAVPMQVFSAPAIFNGDIDSTVRRVEMYGPRRNCLNGDYIWRVSDTTAVLGGGNFDIQAGAVQQFDVGLSRMCWPDLQFYLGSRYLRNVEAYGQKGSNIFTFAATYVLDQRYTLVYSGQFDFDYGAGVRSDVTLIRRYHRVYCGLTYSADQSLDRQAIIFSIWPEGLAELAIGPRRYMEISGSSSY